MYWKYSLLLQVPVVTRFSQDPPNGGGVGVRTPAVTATSTLPQSELLPRDAEGGAFTKSAVRPKTPPLTGNPGNAGAPDRLRRRERVSADVTLAASNHLSGMRSRLLIAKFDTPENAFGANLLVIGCVVFLLNTKF